MRLHPLFRPLLLLCLLFALTSAAQAQNRYTFVSMTGNDANNCLGATTACRTFQRAHDVVSDGGTVMALDSGGYGPIVITKSVTITGEGVEAGLTVTGSNVTGVAINTAGVVRLRHLSITGLNTTGSSNGIFYTGGAALHVEHCKVTGFASSGLIMGTTGPLYVSDSVFRNNAFGIQASGLVGAGTGITIERTLIEQNTAVGMIASGGKTTIRKSRLAGNPVGLEASNAGAEVTVDDCNISHNGFSVLSQSGAVVRVANSTIVNNVDGPTFILPGQILTRNPASNTVEGNTNPGPGFSGTYTAQ